MSSGSAMMMRQLRRMLPSDEQLPHRLRWLRMRTCKGFLRLTLALPAGNYLRQQTGCLTAIPAFKGFSAGDDALLFGDACRVWLMCKYVVYRAVMLTDILSGRSVCVTNVDFLAQVE